MGLDLPSGGHLTHGYQTSKKKISSTSIFFESMPYQVKESDGLIDYEQLEANARLFHPKLLVCGGSAYPREWDYARFAQIARENNAMLMCDMAHISGLVAAGEAENPFKYCDIVTTTTHKTLRGPRAGLIFYRKVDAEGKSTGLEERINFAVFPGCQGGPHNNTIAAVAVALKQAASPEFKAYAKAVRQNSAVLARELTRLGYTVCTNGTDNHLILWDLRPQGLSGAKMDRLCEMMHITINKNSVHGDKSAMSPGGVRLGSAALTSRGLGEAEFVKVAQFLHQAVQLGLEIQAASGGKLLKDFVKATEGNEKIAALREEVQAFASAFPMPGRD